MPQAFLIDLTRLASRFGGQVLSGVDRVELAWLNYLVKRPEPAHGLIRLHGRQRLVSSHGLTGFATGFTDGVSPDPLRSVSGLWPRRSRSRAGVRVSLARSWAGSAKPGALASLLDSKCPKGTTYLNLGHSNLSKPVAEGIKAATNIRSLYLVHDAIPLDFPSMQSAAVAGTFGERLRAIGDHADMIAYSTQHARASVEAHLGPERPPESVVAPFGTGLADQDLPQLDLRPEFVAISTIEPRKNLQLLLGIWDELIQEPPPSGIPKLTVIGRRGWEAGDVLDHLDRLKRTGLVSEVNDATDRQTVQALRQSSGLLFPSLAEGFGFPPLDAVRNGVPVISSPLPSVREILGDIPVYVEPSDHYRWRETIIQMMDKKEQTAERTRIGTTLSKQALPTWDDHFNTILSALG